MVIVQMKLKILTRFWQSVRAEREREEKDYFIEYFYEHMSTHLIKTSCSNL